MKLQTRDNADLMEVSDIRAEGSNMVVFGTIMGAMPVEAVLTPSELRKVFKLLNFKLIVAVLRMLFSK